MKFIIKSFLYITMKWSFGLLSFLSFTCDAFLVNRRNVLDTIISGHIIKPDVKNIIQMTNESPPPSSSQEITIMQESHNEIYLYGAITQRSCFELKKLLTDMNIKMKTYQLEYNIESPPPIHLHLQSEGGSLYHTLYIIDLIRNLDTDVYTYIDGFAASAATLISVVGKKRFMTTNSLMLIHQLSGADSGKFNELQDQMSNMSILMSILTNVYLNYTKIDKETLNELLKKDLWLDAETCLKYGFVDEIL